MNICIFSDGTGNAASAIWRTNVRRVFDAVDLSGTTQIAFYDDGVGSSSFKPLAVLGGAFGWGLKRNVLDLYKAVCRNYKAPGDDIFAFGFSRGAYTIRVLIGLILNQGLVRYNTEAELNRSAKHAYRAYRAEKFHSVHRFETVIRWFRDRLTRNNYFIDVKPRNLQVTHIRFVGLWDTVAAYGLPVDEMTRGVSLYLWPLELPDRSLNPKVKRACHALSLDDERTTFHPLLWDESEGQIQAPRDQNGNGLTKDERITQVWFSGMHANVGGGYPDDTLAHIPLCWVMEEAEQCGLVFKTSPVSALTAARAARDKDGRIYDPRSGLGGYYRYGPRKVYDFCHMRLSRQKFDRVEIGLPKIHESALKRINNEVNPYAPIGLPPAYEIVTDNREIIAPANNSYETPAESQARSQTQERVWNHVWKRRIVYFLTVFTSLYLVLFPLWKAPDPSLEYTTWLRPISDLIAIVDALLPDVFDVWLHAFRREPGRFVGSVLVLWGLISLGSRLRSKIDDEMRSIWRTEQSMHLPNDVIYRLRTSWPYTTIHWLFKRYILPFAFAVLIAYLVWAFASRVVVMFLDSAGYFCRPSENAVVLRDTQPVTVRFNTSSICTASGVILQEGKRYRISIKQVDAWRENDVPTNLGGIHIANLRPWDRLKFIAALPMKRTMIRPWFRPIARIGSTGNDEEFLDPDLDLSTSEHQENIRARKNGELFFYVNDAILAVPRYWNAFYRNNVGQAEVTIQLR